MAVRSTALWTVRTASIGRSSPKCQRRIGSGPLVGGAGALVVVVASSGRLEVREDPPQGRLPKASQCLGRHRDAVAVPLEVTLSLELALQLTQRPQVLYRRGGELALHRLDVDIVEARARILLGQLVVQRVQIGEIGHRADCLSVPERLVTADIGGSATAEARPQRLQVVVQLGQLALEIEVAERLRHQLRQLVTLV